MRTIAKQVAVAASHHLIAGQLGISMDAALDLVNLGHLIVSNDSLVLAPHATIDMLIDVLTK